MNQIKSNLSINRRGLLLHKRILYKTNSRDTKVSGMDELHKIVIGDHDMWRDEIPLGPQHMQILKLVIEYACLRCQLRAMVELNLNSIREYYAPEFLCTSHFKFITNQTFDIAPNVVWPRLGSGLS